MVFVTPVGLRIRYNDSRWAHEHVLPDLMCAVQRGLLTLEHG